MNAAERLLHAGGGLGFPKPQQAVLAVRGDQVLVRVVGDADYVSLVNLWVHRYAD